jgi:outer membrane protein assembly factor BamB
VYGIGNGAALPVTRAGAALSSAAMLPALAKLAVSLVPSAASQAPADWPQFGGPNGNNRVGSLATDFAWGAEGPKVLWRAPTGPGFGGVAVQGGEVFLFDCELGESELLRVFDLESGAEKWSTAYEAKGRVAFPGSRCVPAVTADAVYASGAFGHVTCFDRETHEIRWQEHMQETYGGEDPGFGFSSSPIVVDDLVVFSALGAEVGLVAFDLASGEERWVTEGVGFSHSTPVRMTLLGEPQLVILGTGDTPTGLDEAAPMSITSIDPRDGARKWQHVVTLSRLPIPGPLQIDEQRFFLTGGYRSGSKLLRIAKQGDGYAFEELFTCERGAQTHFPLLHGEHLYLLANENWNERPVSRRSEGGLVCLGLDGKERWRTGDAPYFGRGNALLAGDHLLIQDGYDGTLRVVQASPEGYRPVAEARLFEGGSRDGQMWAPMALSGERLLLRSQEELVCVQL